MPDRASFVGATAGSAAGVSRSRNLSAGTYPVCIAGFNEMATNYLLTIGVYTPL